MREGMNREERILRHLRRLGIKAEAERDLWAGIDRDMKNRRTQSAKAWQLWWPRLGALGGAAAVVLVLALTLPRGIRPSWMADTNLEQLVASVERAERLYERARDGFIASLRELKGVIGDSTIEDTLSSLADADAAISRLMADALHRPVEAERLRVAALTLGGQVAAISQTHDLVRDLGSRE